MSISYIRTHYGVPFKIGDWLRIKPGASELLGVRTGKLVRAKGAYLTIKGSGWAGNFHPMDVELASEKSSAQRVAT